MEVKDIRRREEMILRRSVLARGINLKGSLDFFREIEKISQNGAEMVSG